LFAKVWFNIREGSLPLVPFICDFFFRSGRDLCHLPPLFAMSFLDWGGISATCPLVFCWLFQPAVARCPPLETGRGLGFDRYYLGYCMKVWGSGLWARRQLGSSAPPLEITKNTPGENDENPSAIKTCWMEEGSSSGQKTSTLLMAPLELGAWRLVARCDGCSLCYDATTLFSAGPM